LTILKKLIDHNADINCLDEQKRTPFIWAASAGEIFSLLEKKN
jgi:ankyrin repeat protein